MTTSKQLDQEPDQKENLSSEQARSATRRRLIQGATAAPVLLVTGRSALACDPNTDKCALSPMAWMSVHPNNKTATVQLSHSVGCNFLGKSPGYWTPNKTGQTFQGPWPSGVLPFNSLTLRKKDRYGKCLTTTQPPINWVPLNWKNYKNLPFIDSCTGKDPGWNTGSRLPFSTDPRSISKIMIDESGTDLWHFCAAYLNALTYPGQYALTLKEIQDLYSYGTLVSSGRKLYSDEIKAFLEQTWA